MRAFIVLVVIFCQSSILKSQDFNANKVQRNNFDYRVITFQIDNSDTTKFGFVDYKCDEAIGVKSILLAGDSVILMDEFHSNIKIFNLSDSTLSCTRRFSGFVNDIGLYKNKFYLLGIAYIHYIADENFQQIDTFRIPFSLHEKCNYYPGKKKFFVDENNNIYLFHVGGYLKIDETGNVIDFFDYWATQTENPEHSRRPLSLSDLNSYAHNKKFQFVKEKNAQIITTDYFECELMKPYIPGAGGKYLNCVNFDFDTRRLVLFEVSPTEFILHVYTLKEE
ncbi:MAG: hypothetical protein KKD31_13355 [Bacteroidetes bacterium]|nr:hypothetical protein [Bacteroidota bacterium]